MNPVQVNIYFAINIFNNVFYLESTSVDDEYRTAGIVDPKLMITTSRDPSSRLLQFAKEMKILLRILKESIAVIMFWTISSRPVKPEILPI